MNTQTNTDYSKEIATNIFNQLGGKRFLLFTGSKNLVRDENWLRMDLAKNKINANRMKITLNGLDLYDVEFYSMRRDRKSPDGFRITEKAKYENVYFDQLQDIFTEATGLYTRF